MTIRPETRRYIFCLSALILILQVAVATGQSKKSGVTVSYEQSGTSRIARFANSNSYPVRVEFSYQGTRSRGSGEASGEDAVLWEPIFSPPMVRAGFPSLLSEPRALCGRTEAANALATRS
jgi:hypothetical protein